VTTLEFLIPIALGLGGLGLIALLWALRAGQYDDLDAAAWRILADETPAKPKDRDPE
jgi:cbb3-type cytochrome oxidase maturation protein